MTVIYQDDRHTLSSVKINSVKNSQFLIGLIYLWVLSVYLNVGTPYPCLDLCAFITQKKVKRNETLYALSG